MILIKSLILTLKVKLRLNKIWTNLYNMEFLFCFGPSLIYAMKDLQVLHLAFGGICFEQENPFYPQQRQYLRIKLENAPCSNMKRTKVETYIDDVITLSRNKAAVDTQ